MTALGNMELGILAIGLILNFKLKYTLLFSITGIIIACFSYRKINTIKSSEMLSLVLINFLILFAVIFIL